MKLAITITQCKRVVLPHFFCTYVLPQMRARFSGPVAVFLVQHVGGLPEKRNFLRTSQLGQQCLERVRGWTEEGKFPGAEIIRHEERFEAYPHLPSLIRANEAALAWGADLHLWLEDDAIVADDQCDAWPDLMKENDAGVYRERDIIHIAHFLSTRDFDERLRPRLLRPNWWDLQRVSIIALRRAGVDLMKADVPRIEVVLAQNCVRGRARLPDRFAARTHRPGPGSNEPSYADNLAGVMTILRGLDAAAAERLQPLLLEET